MAIDHPAILPRHFFSFPRVKHQVLGEKHPATYTATPRIG